MEMGEAPNPGANVEVRFSALGCGCTALMVAVFPALLAAVPHSGIRLILATSSVLIVAYGLFLIVATFAGSKPILIVTPEGIQLPIAGDVFIAYDCVEVWADPMQAGWIHPKSLRPDPWTFSLQQRPRTQIDIPWWTWIWMARANTLIGGDLLLDERFISMDARDLVAVIEARRATGI